MAPLPTVARRAAGLGLIPSAVITATFLLGLVLRSPFLVNYLGLGALPAVVVVCLWAGTWGAGGRRTWRDRLGAGLLAGVSAGLVAGALDVVVVIGLSMAQVVFGLWIHGRPSVVVAGHLQPVTVAIRAARLLNAPMLLAAVEGLLADAVLGAGVGAVGAALRAILPGAAGTPGQPSTAS